MVMATFGCIRRASLYRDVDGSGGQSAGDLLLAGPIGTGKTPTPDDAQQVHALIRARVGDRHQLAELHDSTSAGVTLFMCSAETRASWRRLRRSRRMRRLRVRRLARGRLRAVRVYETRDLFVDYFGGGA